MILEDNIVEKFLSEKASTNITDKVNELKKLSNFSNYEEINVGSIFSKVKLEELKNSKDVALEIAKLSVRLLVDFNYYSRFCFKGKYNNSFFEERLKKLGYINDNDIWKYPLTSKPERSIVLENVFIHHIINELLNSKDESDCDENNSSDIENVKNTTPMSNVASNHNGKIENERANNDNKKQLSLRENKSRTEDNNSHLRVSWICKRCTFVNDSNISNCETCFASNAKENENLPTKRQSENLPDDKKFIEEKQIFVPETIDESNSPTSLISRSIQKNEEKFNLNDEFNNEKDEFNNEKDEFNKEKDKFKNEKDKFKNEKDKFNNVDDEFNNEKDKFNNEKDKFNNEKDKFGNENDKFNNEKDRFNNVDDEFNNEKDKFNNEKDKFNNEKDKFGNVDDEFINEKDKFNSVDDEFNGMNETSECFKCKEKINKKKLSLCDNCSEIYCICPNEACTQIYKHKSKFCQKCKVQNYSNLKNGNSFKVYRRIRNKPKWQCGFCYTIISESQTKCIKCGNTRESFYSK